MNSHKLDRITQDITNASVRGQKVRVEMPAVRGEDVSLSGLVLKAFLMSIQWPLTL